MPKKPSHKQLEERVKTLEHKQDLLLFFLYDTGFNAADFMPRDHQAKLVISDDGHYYAQLFRGTGAHGGYVVIRSLKDGACPTITYLDDIDDKWPLELRILADRLRVIRQKMLDAMSGKALPTQQQA